MPENKLTPRERTVPKKAKGREATRGISKESRSEEEIALKNRVIRL